MPLKDHLILQLHIKMNIAHPHMTLKDYFYIATSYQDFYGTKLLIRDLSRLLFVDYESRFIIY